MRPVQTLVLSLAVIFGIAPAFAETGAPETSSEAQICKARLDQAQTVVKSMTDPTKQNVAKVQVDLAEAAMKAGNPTKCIVELQKMPK